MTRTIYTPGDPTASSSLASAPVRNNFTALYEGDLKPLRVTEQASPGMTVQVASDEGRAYVVGNTPIGFTGGNSPTFVEPALGGYKRIDVLTLDSTGTLNITNGTAVSGTPVAPTYPADELPLAEIYLRNGMTSIKNLDDATNGYIIPRQPVFNLGDIEVGEGNLNISPFSYNSVVGTWALNADSGCINGGGFLNSSGAINDSATYKIYIEAGTYTFRMVVFKNTNRGIATIKINGNTVGTIDLYNGVTLRNQIGTITGIVIAARGLVDLEIVALSKHGSSSAYTLYLNEIILFRTA